MNTTDERNLEACVLAITRRGKQLSPALHSKIQAAGHQLAEDESAVYELRSLIDQDDALSRSYDQARIELQAKYEDARERSKSGAAVMQNGANGAGSFVRSLAIPILTADNIDSVAQRLVTQPNWQTQAKQASEDVQTFFAALKDSVTSLNPLAIKLLKILDEDIFEIDSLAYRVYLTEEAIKPVLEDLWQRGYIRRVSGTVTGNLFGSFNVFGARQHSLNTDGYLSLTVRGYYYLHPHPLYKVLNKTLKALKAN